MSYSNQLPDDWKPSTREAFAELLQFASGYRGPFGPCNL